MKKYILVGLFVLLVALVTLIVLRPNLALTWTFDNQFAIPRNGLTEQLEAIEKIRTKGTIQLPASRVVVTLPATEIGGSDVTFNEVYIAFPSNTDLNFDFDFAVKPSEGSSETSTETVAVYAEINSFEIGFSEEVEIGYEDKPLLSVDSLSLSESSLDVDDKRTSQDGLSISARTKFILGHTLLQAMMNIPFEKPETTLAVVESGKSKILLLPGIKIDTFDVFLKPGSEVTYDETNFKVGPQSGLVSLRDFDLKPKASTSDNLVASGDLSISLAFLPTDLLTIGATSIVQPDELTLDYSGSFKLSNQDLAVVSSGESSRFAIRDFALNQDIGDGSVEFKNAGVDAVLIKHNFHFDLSKASETSFRPGNGNVAVVTLELSNGSIDSESLLTEIESIELRDAELSYRVDGEAAHASLMLPGPTQIKLTKLIPKKSNIELQFGEKATVTLPQGDVLHSDGLRFDLRELMVGVDAMLMNLPGKGLIRAKGISLESDGRGVVNLADEKTTFDGEIVLNKSIEQVCYYENSGEIAKACAANISCNLKLEGNGQTLNVTGSIGDGTSVTVDAFDIKAEGGDVRVLLGEIRFTPSAVEYPDIRVRIKKSFLNRLIAANVASLNSTQSEDNGQVRTKVTISRASASLGQLGGDSFGFSGSLRVSASVQTKTKPEVKMVRVEKKVFGNRISYHEPRTSMGWMTIVAATADGSLGGQLNVTFNKGVSLDKLKGKAVGKVNSVNVDIKNVPGGVNQLISRLWKEFGSSKIEKSFYPLSGLSAKELSTVKGITVNEIKFANEPECVVLKIAGTSPR